MKREREREREWGGDLGSQGWMAFGIRGEGADGVHVRTREI